MDHREIQSLYDSVIDAQLALAQTLMADTDFCVQCLWYVPLRGTAEPANRIRVEAMTGDDARRWAVHCLTTPYLSEGQHPQESLRCPGLIRVAPATLHAINEVNRLKDALEAALATLNEPQRRPYHRSRPRLSARHVLRRYEIVLRPEQLRFQWVTSYAIARFSAGDYRAHCLTQINSLGNTEYRSINDLPQYPDDTALWRLSKHIRDSLRAPDAEVLGERRPVRPHIRCYVRADNERYYANVALPLIQSSAHPAPRIDALGHFPPPTPRRRGGTSHFESTPLVQGQPVFRYLPEFREQADSARQDLRYARKRYRESLD